MSVYHGKKLTVKIIGESHGEKITAYIGGLKRFGFDKSAVENDLKRRSPMGKAGATERIESDVPIYAKGVRGGKITGRVVVEFRNRDIKADDYKNMIGIPRPSHADIGRYFKNGDVDFTGGGEYSGRVTVGLCAVGSICKDILDKYYGVKISAYLSSVGGEFIKSYNLPDRHGADDDEVSRIVRSAKEHEDSLGAKVECIVSGVPAGVGGSLFDGIDGKIATLVYSIPAVKGVEFGKGFALCDMPGSKADDGIRFDGEKIVFEKNDDGGIYGGIACGEIRFAVAFKPTPSIQKRQNSVNLLTGENVTISIGGRHDACVAIRALPIVEAAAAIAILDEVLYEKR